MARPKGGSLNTSGEVELNEMEHTEQDAPKQPVKVKKRNDGIDLSPFTYSGNFIGAQFKRYEELQYGKYERNELRQLVPVAPGLLLHHTYEFEGYKVRPIRALVNPDKPQEGTELIGFEVLNTTPFKTSTTAWKNIKVLNDQIHAANTGNQPVLYYLLKK